MDDSDDITSNIPKSGLKKKLTIKTLKSPPVASVDNCDRSAFDQDKLASDSDNWAFDDPDDYSQHKTNSNQVSIVRTTPRGDDQFTVKLAHPGNIAGLFDV